jgi:hypothetical protein
LNHEIIVHSNIYSAKWVNGNTGTALFTNITSFIKETSHCVNDIHMLWRTIELYKYNRLSSLKTLFLVNSSWTCINVTVVSGAGTAIASGGTTYIVYIISARREFQMLTYLRLLLLLSALYIIDNLSFAATDESVLCIVCVLLCIYSSSRSSRCLFVSLWPICLYVRTLHLKATDARMFLCIFDVLSRDPPNGIATRKD